MRTITYYSDYIEKQNDKSNSTARPINKLNKIVSSDSIKKKFIHNLHNIAAHPLNHCESESPFDTVADHLHIKIQIKIQAKLNGLNLCNG